MPVRITGVNLQDNERIEYSLTSIYGIGFAEARKILAAVGVDLNKKVKDLLDTDVKKITDWIEKNYKVEGDLKAHVQDNIKRLKEIGSYRGLRHVRGLPARGQRTRSNARTRKGKKRTIGALTKEAWAKIDQVQNTAPVK
ncbi:MAG: 30S ribosomal protein S13 [Patescibacteria group bacterium]|jgi:small subunit ribosomal protein S13